MKEAMALSAKVHSYCIHTHTHKHTHWLASCGAELCSVDKPLNYCVNLFSCCNNFLCQHVHTHTHTHTHAHKREREKQGPTTYSCTPTHEYTLYSYTHTDSRTHTHTHSHSFTFKRHSRHCTGLTQLYKLASMELYMVPLYLILILW